MAVFGVVKEIGAGIGSILKRSKAKRQAKRAAKAEAAAQAALERSQQLAARAGFGGSILEAKVSAAPAADGGAVEEKMARFVADVKQGFNLMQWVKKNIIAVVLGVAAFIGFVLWLTRKRKKRR
jgi:LPXTG-motif cell wall-anchored protein